MLSKITHIQILLLLSCALRGHQNTIEGQGKDLATRGAARGLVSLSACRTTLAR